MLKTELRNLRLADDATAMLRRANQHGDESLAVAVAGAAFQRGSIGVAQEYADQAGKRGALDLLIDATPGRFTNLADSTVFRIRNPEELSTAAEPTLRDLAQIHAPGMGEAR